MNEAFNNLVDTAVESLEDLKVDFEAAGSQYSLASLVNTYDHIARIGVFLQSRVACMDNRVGGKP